MIWFISDQHHNHKNICCEAMSAWKSGFRNFASLREMSDCIIDNINSSVQPDDILYDLGDFAMGQRKFIPAIRERIRCRNYHLIFGNHDGTLRRKYQDCFTTCQDYLELRYKGTLLCMMHYPLAVWRENGRGAINLHGHCHHNYVGRGKQLDVGVDGHGFAPISIEDVMERMGSVEVAFVDHHTDESNYG